jgi:predicted esterase
MQRSTFRLSAAFLLLSVVFTVVPAQDPGQILALSVRFRSIKNTAKMTDEQRKEVETLEKQAREATNNQKLSEAYKLYSKAIAAARGQAWTPSQALTDALQARTERSILDPGDKLVVILTQYFSPDPSVEGTLQGKLEIKNSVPGSEKEIRALRGVGADFAKPLIIEAKLPDLPDGDYFLSLSFNAREGTPIVKSIPLRIARGLTAEADALKTRIADLTPKLKSKQQDSLLTAMAGPAYTASIVDQINSGRIKPTGNLKSDMALAGADLDQLARGENPLLAKRGDVHWAYRSTVDDTLQPYRFYIPSTYDASKRWPLIVALHGMGGDENSFFAGYDNGALKRMAESRGYLVVCPKGRQPASMYMGAAEKDVIDVLSEMKREFSIDDSRVYLMGHSMGGYGSWSVAANHPQLFAAIAPFAGGGTPFTMAKLQGLANTPWIVIHGDADPTVSVEESRKMVKAGQALGVKIKYIEVPGGNHGDIVVPKFKDVFDWFDAHTRQTSGAAKTAGSGQN